MRSEVTIAMIELSRIKKKRSRSTERNRRLHQMLDRQLSAFFLRNGYDSYRTPYEPPHTYPFDDMGIGYGESLICGLHADDTWIEFVRRMG